ncbi:MAG: hypothetical protein A7316_04340 [Candidatus Altiarchaeales archaeon WOR_SM1_86-2]|nr:MAG: hypothetical protein A7316_04340 [Candidatus Altiarchaeales archaeon WOR_SM1_86-2]ODS37457.1 MAG: hypothetical protein A7315_04100 [Candidatus Altiarchaeales archaeon WOR_SM1_79]
MLENITYLQILGKPLIMYLGIITLLFLFLTVSIAVLNMKGIYRIHPEWHPRMAKIAVTLAIIHGILGVLSYL